MLTNKKTTKGINLRDNQITFNDGVCRLYEANERTLTNLKGKFFYKNESIGIKHFWEAYNNNVGIDVAISIQKNVITINPQDVVKLGTDYYRIVRIQLHDNKLPNYWTLFLAKDQFNYLEAIND